MNGQLSAEQVAAQIQQQGGAHRPVLIGIEGYGGSGKSTVAQKLQLALGSAYVVHMDDFIVKEQLATATSWDKSGFDRARLERQVLLPASRQQPISYQALLWETNSLSEPKVVPDIDYLIVEGIASYHPDIAQYYTYKIWVDTPIGVASARGKARDAGNENVDKWDTWAKTDLAYQQKHHPEQAADFIIFNA